MADNVVMGIDPSLTSTGYVVLRNGVVVDNGTIQTELLGMERLVYIENHLHVIMRTYDPDKVYIEGYSYGSIGKSVYQIGELGGIIRMMLWFQCKNFGGPAWKEIPPSQLKKFATGKGNAKKEDMKLAVFKKWGIEFPTNDEVDAFVLAKMAEQEA